MKTLLVMTYSFYQIKRKYCFARFLVMNLHLQILLVFDNLLSMEIYH